MLLYITHIQNGFKKLNRFKKNRGWVGFIFSASNTLIEYIIHKIWTRIGSE